MTAPAGVVGARPPAPGPGWARVPIAPVAVLAVLALGAALWANGRADLAGRAWTVGLVVGGAPVVWRTLRGVVGGHFASDLVATLAIVTAVIQQQPLAGLVVVLMQTGGEALERYAEGRASAAVRALEEDAPRVAHRLAQEGGEVVRDVAVDAVAVGDLLLVRPGEMVPCDADVVDGSSHVDTARLTGEPVPERVGAGARVMSGSLNVDGALTVRTVAVAGESQYARIVELVRSAQASKAPLQRLADRYAVWFTPATLLVCLVAYLASGDAGRVLAVLVVATPCPLILATPVAIIGGINRAARRLVVVRHGGALEQLASVTAAVFDKTGTLTVGTPEVSRVVGADGHTDRDVLALAAALEERSGHLLARSVTRAAAAAGVRVPAGVQITEAAGRGVSGVVDGHRVVVGARRFVLEHAPGTAGELGAGSENGAGLSAHVAVDGRLAGVIEFADRLRPGLPAFFRSLERLGIRRTVLLSGDSAAHTRAVADAVGIQDARGDLLPGDKVAVVRELERGGERVVMVGDGTNDAPALSAATVGVALAGSPGHGRGITAEAADVVVLADDVAAVAEAIRIGRRTLRVARQSIWVGLGLSATAMVVAALGYIPPTVGAVLQEVIDVAVILNALRASR